MKKYIGFLFFLGIFVFGGSTAQAVVNPNSTPCASTAIPSVTVTYPNGGEVYNLTDTLRPTWKYNCMPASYDASVYIVDLANSTEYYLGSGESSFGTTINHTPSIANAVSLGQKNFKLKVSSGNLVDYSDNTFTIKSAEVAPYVKVVSPNGGEVVNISNPFIVTFKSNNVSPAKHYINLIDITADHAYSLDSLLGSSGLMLTQGQINQPTQSISVSIPDSYNLNLSHAYKIEILVNNLSDRSDKYFKLVKTNFVSICGNSTDPSVKVLSPNGGEAFEIDGAVEVKWRTCNISSDNKMTIGLYDSETGQHIYFSGPHSNFTLNDGKETFHIPASTSGGQYTMTVSTEPTSTSGTVIDYSDNKFTLKSSDAEISTTTEVSSVNKMDTPDLTLRGVLKRGIKNASVTAIQNALIKSGYSLVLDGSFGPKTENAVKLFQQKNNLIADGVVGPKTWVVIDSIK